MYLGLALFLAHLGLAFLLPRSPSTTPAYETYSSCTNNCFTTLSAQGSISCADNGDFGAFVTCLCSDTATQTLVAQCVYTKCSLTELQSAAATAVYNCKINGSPDLMSLAELVAAGELGVGKSQNSAFCIPSFSANRIRS